MSFDKRKKAMNEHEFIIIWQRNTATAKALLEMCRKMDLDILKYHFGIGVDSENFVWA